ncbi:MAG TPA: Rieske 2Fe-2S domain-containing protein, partial [Anaerolineaceae bacterium]
NEASMQELAVQTYEAGLELQRPAEKKEVFVAGEGDIPEGERKLIEAEGISIGIFHHKGKWVALRNHCLHRGGPVATGILSGDVLTCPWHGYQYDVNTGNMLVDQALKLDTYPVDVRDGKVYINVPLLAEEQAFQLIIGEEKLMETARPVLPEGSFYRDQIAEGKAGLVHLDGEGVAVYHTGGEYYATSATCTHEGGPLNEGDLKGTTIVCPWHGSCFDVTSGAVRCGPARMPVRSYRVILEGEVGRVAAE